MSDFILPPNRKFYIFESINFDEVFEPLDLSRLRLNVDINFYRYKSNAPFLVLNSGKIKTIDDEVYATFGEVSVEKGIDQIGLINQDKVSFTLTITSNNIKGVDLVDRLLYNENSSIVLKQFDDIEIVANVVSGKFDRNLLQYKFRGVVTSITPNVSNEGSMKQILELSIEAQNIGIHERVEMGERLSPEFLNNFLTNESNKGLGNPILSAEPKIIVDDEIKNQDTFGLKGFKLASGDYYTVAKVIKLLLEDITETQWETHFMSMFDIYNSYKNFTKLVYVFYKTFFGLEARKKGSKGVEIINKFLNMNVNYEKGISAFPLIGEFLISREDIKNVISKNKQGNICSIINEFFNFIVNEMYDYLKNYYPNLTSKANIKNLKFVANIDEITANKKSLTVMLVPTRGADCSLNKNIDLNYYKKHHLLLGLDYNLSSDRDQAMNTLILKTSKDYNSKNPKDDIKNTKDITIENKANYPWGRCFLVEGNLKLLMTKTTTGMPLRFFNSGFKPLNGNYVMVQSVNYTFGNVWETEIEFVGLPGNYDSTVAKSKEQDIVNLEK